MRSTLPCLTPTWSRCGWGTWGRCWLPGIQALQAARPCRKWVYLCFKYRNPCPYKHVTSPLPPIWNMHCVMMTHTCFAIDSKTTVEILCLLPRAPAFWMPITDKYSVCVCVCVHSISKQPSVPLEQAGKLLRINLYHKPPMALCPSLT